MADKLNLKITAETEYYSIKLRKFFCMVFFDKTGKILDVFLATVFGGYAKENGEPPKPYPSYRQGEQAELKFDFSSPNEQSVGQDKQINPVKEIEFSDITDKLLDQSDKFSSFWGITELLNNTGEIKKQINELYGIENKEKVSNVGVGTNSRDLVPFYFIDNQRYPVERCVVTKGVSEKIENNFTLKSNPHASSDGIEYINWIKCHITLKQSVLGKRSEFCITLSGIEKTPDFTWYFAPPVDYSIDSDNAVLSVKGQNANGEEIKCEREKNRISPVSDNTTVDFQQWEDLHILKRSKSRVILEKNCNITEIRTLIYIIENADSRSTRQFFDGLIIAFLLSYFADQTRVNDIVAKFALCQLLRTIIPIILPVMIGLGAINCLLRLKRKERDDKNNEKSRFCREFGFWSTIVVAMLYIFVPIFAKTVSTVGIVIFFSLLALSIISNGIYLFCYERILKRSLRDIL